MRLALIAAGTAGLAACATPRLTPVPLRPEPVAYADTLRIPEPKERKENRYARAVLVHGPLQLAEPFDPGEGEALNVTRDDDVVGSTWWERRMGYEPIAPARLAQGPTSPDGAPAAAGPLTVKSAKTEGVTPGFTVKDGNGNTYILKFDPPDYPHLQSAPGVISNRLMWGAGFHVPEDYLTEVDVDRLVVDPKATIEEGGRERPLTLDDVKGLLRRTRPIDGKGRRYLAFASRYLPGVPKGPFYFDDTRNDDPNDYYEHQHRRELRALWVFSAWINDGDMREGNTLDVYVKPGYLRHYLIDFGATLGSGSTRAKQRKDETERPVDLYRFGGRLLTLGFYKQEWEDEQGDAPPSPSLGFLRGEDFDPDTWHTAWTNRAFLDMTDADAYWATKILSAFSDEHVRAAVSVGRLPNQAVQDTLFALIAQRRDILIRHFYSKVSTVEEPTAARQGDGSLRLSFRDLGLEQQLWSAGETIYDWTFHDPRRGRSGNGSAQPRAGEDQLMDVEWTEADRPRDAGGDELARLAIVTRRPGLSPDPATIFLRWTGSGYRVTGITHGDPDY